MQQACGQAGSSKQRRGDFRPLAPRDSRPSSGRDRASNSASGRPPRLSHRSRAGCWTCRGRKVKCDETHPRCGPCTRLNRECDWDHRWNFNDSTISTQDKYSNVNILGNAVWDPSVRHRYSASHLAGDQDPLDDFATLTTDEDRELKACTQRPGTYGVVVTPESFHDLPEYSSLPPLQSGSRRTSAVSTASTRGHRSPGMPILRRSRTQPDPNTIVLERFEDISPISSPTGPFPSSARDNSRGGSHHENHQRLTINTKLYPSIADHVTPLTPSRRADDQLLAHFRRHIVPRLVQPQEISEPGLVSQGSTRDVLESKASDFKPLHDAICAVSALNLAYKGKSSLEEAMQHYHQALAASTTTSSSHDLLSDGVFFRHFILLIYDICIPMHTDDEGTDMWVEHLNHLSRLALSRIEKNGGEPFAYTLWTICELDMYACLMGRGSCSFVRMISEQNMIPRIDQHVPCMTSTQDPLTGAFRAHEMDLFPAILRLNRGMVLLGAKVAQAAREFRSEATHSPGTTARWQARATALQNEIASFWIQNLPPQLALESPHATLKLPDRVRAVFEHALTLYHALVIYARTSMFSSQRTIPVAGQSDVLADMERRVMDILQIAEAEVEAGLLERRHVVFPLFMAGYASFNHRIKGRVMEVMDCFVGSGIGQNTARCRKLLGIVVQEQMRVEEQGGKPESVDWIRLGRDRGLAIVNCGL